MNDLLLSDPDTCARHRVMTMEAARASKEWPLAEHQEKMNEIGMALANKKDAPERYSVYRDAATGEFHVKVFPLLNPKGLPPNRVLWTMDEMEQELKALRAR
jgi:hypothetical protein